MRKIANVEISKKHFLLSHHASLSTLHIGICHFTTLLNIRAIGVILSLKQHEDTYFRIIAYHSDNKNSIVMP